MIQEIIMQELSLYIVCLMIKIIILTMMIIIRLCASALDFRIKEKEGDQKIDR